MTTQTTRKLTRDTLGLPYWHVTPHLIDGARQETQGYEIIKIDDPVTNTVWG